MTNILMSTLQAKSGWNNILQKYLENKKVLVIPFAFGDIVKNERDWLKIYGLRSKYYLQMVNPLVSFGVNKKDISWAKYYSDTSRTLKEKINKADVLFFSGGYPDLMMKRLKDMDVIKSIQKFKGTVIGFSAGAMVQIENFHITPDKDYNHFSYHYSLELLHGFDVEVHYEKSEDHDAYIDKVIMERNIPVYAIGDNGIVIVEDNQFKSYGDVTFYHV